MDSGLESLLAGCLSKVKVPQHYDRVFKDECMFSFDTPLSEGGLYLNLNTHQSFGKEYVDMVHQSRTEFPLYLHIKWTRVLGHLSVCSGIWHDVTGASI